MAKKGILWTEKQKAIAGRLRMGLCPQAVIGEGHNKKEVYKIAKAVKRELGTNQGTKQGTDRGTDPGYCPRN
jgi:hypothetical protein